MENTKDPFTFSPVKGMLNTGDVPNKMVSMIYPYPAIYLIQIIKYLQTKTFCLL